MIEVCTKNNIREVFEYIGNSYYECLYLYMDLKMYGTDCPFVTTWIQTQNQRITSVCLMYKKGMHVFSHDCTFCKEEMVHLILEHKPDMLCASGNVIRYLYPSLYSFSYEKEIGYVGRYLASPEKDFFYDDNIKSASEHDFIAIASMLYQDEGIGASYTLQGLASQMLERNKQGFCRNYILKVDSEIVCHVCTGAETEKISIISGVVTKASSRGRGYAARLLRYTCSQLAKQGKEVYSIFYTIPAILLHEREGFIKCCEYGKLFLRKH